MAQRRRWEWREVDRDALAAQWLDYCLRWAERCEARYGDPVGLYLNAAVDGLLLAIRTNPRTNGKMSIEHLNRCLMFAGRDATKTARRRAAKLIGRELMDEPEDTRQLPPDWWAELNEATQQKEVDPCLTTA
jgi:hypothetical protein